MFEEKFGGKCSKAGHSGTSGRHSIRDFVTFPRHGYSCLHGRRQEIRTSRVQDETVKTTSQGSRHPESRYLPRHSVRVHASSPGNIIYSVTQNSPFSSPAVVVPSPLWPHLTYPQRVARLSWPRWLIKYRDGAHATLTRERYPSQY